MNWRGSTTVKTAPISSILSSGLAFNSSITLAACAKPLASIIKRSGWASRSIFCTVVPICAPAVQHKQPPAISATGMPLSLKTAPSMPISPNSLTMMTHFSFGSFCAIRLLRAVVLPVPRKPEIRWTLVFFTSDIFYKFLLKQHVLLLMRNRFRPRLHAMPPILGSRSAHLPYRIRCKPK